MMDYLIRFIQVHESFRKAETEALAELFEIEIEWVLYSENVSTPQLKGVPRGSVR